MLATLEDLLSYLEEEWRNALKSIVGLICICILCAGLTCTQSIAEQTIFQPYAKPSPVPEFALEDHQGKTVDIRDYRGQVLLLNFSAIW
jgi:cytochrome oxidase Cu insertion factor (SCO1/SenC/PrrC family)